MRLPSSSSSHPSPSTVCWWQLSKLFLPGLLLLSKPQTQVLPLVKQEGESIFSGELQRSLLLWEGKNLLGREWGQYFDGCLRGVTYSFSVVLEWVTATPLRRHKKHKLPAEASVLELRCFGSCCAWKELLMAGQWLTLPLSPAALSQREREEASAGGLTF